MVQDGVQNVGAEKDSHRRNPQRPTDRPTDEVSAGPDKSGGGGGRIHAKDGRRKAVPGLDDCMS